jgi:hypothetical protein
MSSIAMLLVPPCVRTLRNIRTLSRHAATDRPRASVLRRHSYAAVVFPHLHRAARVLRATPLFTATAALSLAIGSARTPRSSRSFNALLLRDGLPEPDRLVDIDGARNAAASIRSRIPITGISAAARRFSKTFTRFVPSRSP